MDTKASKGNISLFAKSGTTSAKKGDLNDSIHEDASEE